MPLRDDLLTPIPGANPSGEDLHYNPLYDKIKEARREDDDGPMGDWQRSRKVADWNAVLKLAGDALATKSKDLQLAVWIAEAIVRKESFAGLRQSIDLFRGLLENFWDTLYPEIEDGDVGLRAAPLDRVALWLQQPLRLAPLTRGGYGLLKYKESRTVPTQAQADDDYSIRPVREKAIADGKLTPEEFASSLRESTKEFLKGNVENLDASLESLAALSDFCDEKFGNDSPSFTPFRETIEEIRHVANSLLQTWRTEHGDTDEPEPAGEEEPEAVLAEPEPVAVTNSGAAAAPARTPAAKAAAVASIDPADPEDAAARIEAAARFLRGHASLSPAPYLLLRGFRWGELRVQCPDPDPDVLAAPPSDVRQALKRAVIDADWRQVIDVGERAMAQPCGRAWLDLQRYVVMAAEALGKQAIAAAIKSDLAALIKDIPDLPRWTLLDDTPTANPETQEWLKTLAPSPAPVAAPEPEPEPVRYGVREPERAGPDAEPQPPDAYELALAAARGGRAGEALDILMQESAREASGRGRFQRKLQAAGLCITLGHEAVARPILEQLVAEIEQHGLEEWEAAEMLCEPLTMLLDCLRKLDGDETVRQQLYSKICRLNPARGIHARP